MDGGQKKDIPLNSELDVKSSDMLVPVDAPKFQHNRQQYQGHYLPSSLRFEHDGWAVGNDVYDFDITSASVKTNPEKYSASLLQQSDNAYHVVVSDDATHKEVGYADYVHNRENTVNGITTIEGQFGAKHYAFKYNSLRDTITVLDTTDSTLSIEYIKNTTPSALRKFYILDTASRVFGDINIVPPNSIRDVNTHADVSEFLTYRNNVYTWNGTRDITYNALSNTITMNDNVYAGIMQPDGNVLFNFREDFDNITDTHCTFKVYHFKCESNGHTSSTTAITQDPNKSIANLPNYTGQNYGNTGKFYIETTGQLSKYHSVELSTKLPIWNGIVCNVREGTKTNTAGITTTWTRMYNPVDSDGNVDTHTTVSTTVNRILQFKSNDKIQFYSGAAKTYSLSKWFQYTRSMITQGSTWDNSPKLQLHIAVNTVNPAKSYYLEGGNHPRPDEPDTPVYFEPGFYDMEDYWHKQLWWYEKAERISVDNPGHGYPSYRYPENSSTMQLTIDATIPLNNIDILTGSDVSFLDEIKTALLPNVPASIANEYVKIYTGPYTLGGVNYPDCKFIANNYEKHISAGNMSIVANHDITRVDNFIDYVNTFITTEYHDQQLVTSQYGAVCTWITDDTARLNLSISDYFTSESTADEVLSLISLDNSEIISDNGFYKLCFFPTVSLDSVDTKMLDYSNKEMTVSAYVQPNDPQYHIYHKQLPEDIIDIDPVYLANSIPAMIMFDSIDFINDSSTSYMNTYNLSTQTDYIKHTNVACATWKLKPVNSNVITDITHTLPASMKQDHKFYTDTYSNIDSTFAAQISDFVFNADELYQDIKISLAGAVLNIRSYPEKEHTYELRSSTPVDYDAYTGMLMPIFDGTSISLELHVDLLYTLLLQITHNNSSFTNIVDINGGIVTYKVTDDIYISLNLIRNTANILYMGNIAQIVDCTTDDATGAYVADIYYRLDSYINFIAYGIIDTTLNIRNLNNTTLTFVIDNTEYSIDLEQLENNISESKMVYKYVNTEDPNMDTNYIHAISTSKEFQFLRQQWDTNVTTENFWWIDDSTILVLTQDKFIVRYNVTKKRDMLDWPEDEPTLDDWNGDRWRDVAFVFRSDILTNNILKYGCTSAYGADSTAKLYTVEIISNMIAINIYSISIDFSSTPDYTYYVAINNKELGSRLNDAGVSLNTYSKIDAAKIVNSSVFSATCINNHILFGIHYDNNFNQWALNINHATNTYTTLQGYGYVGVDGSLTGGEIPTYRFDVATGGFNDIVYPLTRLSSNIREATSLQDIYKIDIGDCVVGTDAQQWYISLKVASIVSHLVWIGTTWQIAELPVTSQLAQAYASSSFCINTLTDYMPSVYDLFKDIFPGGTGGMQFVISAISLIAGAPHLFYINPKINNCAELQQTLGQYAYVHYNNTDIAGPEKTTTDLAKEGDHHNETDSGNRYIATVKSDTNIFNLRSVTQSASFNAPFNMLLTMIAGASINAAEFRHDPSKIKTYVDMNATSESGKKFETFSVYQIDALAQSDMSIDSAAPVCTSSVVGMLSLSMFYSTSEQQKISAGPGWVNHNFVAQCVAQSATVHQSRIIQIGISFLMGAFTLFEIEQKINTYKLVRDMAEQQVNASGGGTWSTVVAVAATLVFQTANAMLVPLQSVYKVLPSILEGLGDRKLNVTPRVNKTTSTSDIEYTHSYGSRSECFMWPCFGVHNDGTNTITNEGIDTYIKNNPWTLKIPIVDLSTSLAVSPPINMGLGKFSGITTSSTDRQTTLFFDGNCNQYFANLKGTSAQVRLPDDMAYVIGSETFLPNVPFKNENIGVSKPVFTTPPFQDYIIDSNWQLGRTASASMTTWISCKDTKLIDGELSNAVISPTFCGVAAPYTAIEVRRGITKEYLRPWAITPTALALNITGFNCCYEHKVYHAFDGYGYRLVEWAGAPGMDESRYNLQYSFLINDRFKRSNKMPPNEFLGNFKSDPVLAITGDFNDKIFVQVADHTSGRIYEAGTIGEDKDVRRYAAPVFAEFVSTLPAVVKTIDAYKLSVIDGITTLTSENRSLQTAYKAPISVDFNIGKNLYRYTSEYICTLNTTSGVTVIEDVVPCLGLKFLGATPYEAYLYSQATRQYYIFTGGSSLKMVDMLERFRNIIEGRYDFVNQEVILPCLATFLRLDNKVLDDTDETDNVIIPRLKDAVFIGELYPPTHNIFNTRSWFKTLSIPAGIVYQGPNRCIINRFVYTDYMREQIKNNLGKWKRVFRDTYHPFRLYNAKYQSVDKQIGTTLKVNGWTHNPFLLVTAPLGVSASTDCIFEWEITFCWPVEMDYIYSSQNYAVVNIQAETMTPGGKVIAARPTHVYLYKELFTRTGNYGYYSFRYQSNCGAGNRERLHIWSDQYICVSDLQVEYKAITEKRTEVLTQQLDIQQMTEL